MRFHIFLSKVVLWQIQPESPLWWLESSETLERTSNDLLFYRGNINNILGISSIFGEYHRYLGDIINIALNLSLALLYHPLLLSRVVLKKRKKLILLGTRILPYVFCICFVVLFDRDTCQVHRLCHREVGAGLSAIPCGKFNTLHTV